ncbi:MAG: dihydroorotase [Acutalibacteraceae bacterium]|nr:dihydroorotase [Acutalibacteraceae bacterium]
MNTLSILNARVMDPANNVDDKLNVYIEDGKIADISPEVHSADITIDVNGMVVAPGLVDMHVHLRDPGFTDKEDIITGCNAAAAGGVTSLLAMPNTNPVTDCAEVVEYINEKAKNAKARVYVAAAITKGLKSEEPTDLDELSNVGVIALSDDGRPVENTKFMADAMKKAPQKNMCVVAHCEDLFLADGGKINEGAVSEQLNVKGIPASAEDAGTAREIALAAAYDVPIHICHVSTKTSVALIRDAKNRGVKVTAETAPHYFSLTEKALLSRDADFRMNPPLRCDDDVQAIIDGLCDGTLDAIATDHAPHTPQQKQDFESAPNGSIGMETSLSVGITYLVNKGILTLPQLISKMSVNPANILNIPAGKLSVGDNADIVIFNPDEEYTVDINKLHGKSINTPFKGMKLQGKVKYTVLNGEIVYKD